MNIPSHLFKAKQPIVDDLANVDRNVNYLAVSASTRNIERLPWFSNLSTSWASRVGTKLYELIAGLYKIDSLIIHDMRVGDLRLLGQMNGLSTLVIWGNRKAESLVGIDNFVSLKILALENFSKVRSLEPLMALKKLDILMQPSAVSKFQMA